MRISQPKGVAAGFHFNQPDPAVPELIFCGEYWALPEWFIGDHHHDVWEFYFQAGGESDWAGPHRSYRLQAGDFLAVGPRVSHRMRERPRRQHHFYYAAFRLDAVLRRQPELRPLWQKHSLVHRPQAASVGAPFQQLIREVSLALPHRAQGLRLALDALVLEASRALAMEGRGRSLVSTHPAVIRVKELLDRQSQQPWRLADLARVAGLSPTHLAELFTREVGVPPHQYLLATRIELAKQYLQQKAIPITVLALELGFSSSQHFATTFKRLAGQTPRDYWRRAKLVTPLPAAPS